MNETKPIILGSRSERRKEILSYFSIPFTQVSSSFDENSIDFQGDPQEYVLTLSKGKALALKEKHPQNTIITADTIVYREGKVYGKPADAADAFDYLFELTGRWHSVFTGVTILNQEKIYQNFEETKVLFNVLNNEEIQFYLTKIKWEDKAGGYAIQKAGGLLIKRIDGCYYNVMGLPINTVRKLLTEVGIDLWHYLQEG